METLTYEQLRPGILSEVIKCLHEGILVVNDLNIIEQANAAALKIIGTDAPTLEGLPISQVKARSEAVNDLFALLESEEAADSAHPVNREDGYTHKGIYTVRSLRGDAGPVRIIILHDITWTNKTAGTIAAHTRSLEKSNSELDQFAHIVSHDLKAPLRAISNLSLWLQEDLGGSLSGENRDNLMTLRGRVKRMESLINGILEYSKVGREEMANETIDVYKLVAEVVELLSPPAHITVDISQELPVLEAPKIMLLQVFSNLVSNAIKYNDKEKGVVRVYGEDKGNHFEFVVEDNGPGIPEQYYDKIFVLFQTLQSRDKFESTGIGLTIVRRILEARGGDIQVTSTIGEGSKFIFTWPK